MSDNPSILSRWSRLKREAQARRFAERHPQDVGMLPEPEALPDTAPHALAREELAALPRLEEITAETDLGPFMRIGVPAGLRNAALRRVWALDPSIRDRVGDALDYAYDWNIPGSVPGSGPLLASDDVQAMLRSIVGARDAEKTAVDQESTEAPRLTSDSGSDIAAEVMPASPVAAAHPEPDRTRPAEPAPEENRRQARRHGGATPF